MLFLNSLVIIPVFKLVRSTFQNSSDLPWSGECILELIDDASFGIRSNCATRKNDVANRVDMRVRPTSVDKFLMVQSMFLKEEFSGLMTC